MSDGLFTGVFARGGAAEATTARAWLQAMLDFEAALARAWAREKVVPAETAERIAAACAADAFDVDELGAAAAATATPVAPMVAALRERVGPAAAKHVHRGATSQDVVDTAAMLVVRRALEPILSDTAAAAAACAALAEANRGTPTRGRTLLQQAEPTTFGLRAAGWLVALHEARLRVSAVRDRAPAVQLGGAVGTLAAFDGRGSRLAAEVARQLGLAVPTLPWHTHRGRPAEVAGALGALVGAMAKVALDVALLCQDEIAEVRERGAAGRGGSTAMPHKRNPVAAVSVRACAERVPGLVATMLGAMAQEHERAAGAWQAEWETLSELLRLTGSAAAWTRELMERLDVDPARMHANLLCAAFDSPLPLEVHVRAAAALVDRALTAYGADACP
jgi:3-carboxy-cis,cis-muconate cycloisomerase